MQAVFSGAHTVVRESSTLRRLIEAIDESGWHSDERDTFGDAYEGLLQKNAEETKRGAGQYFTPRSLVNAIVEILDPKPSEIIQDPAAGTGGFLIAANRAIKDKYSSLSSSKQRFQSKLALRGVENVHDTYRLLCMNLYLHNIEADHIFMGDTLSHLGEDGSLKNADIILSNPPFGPSGSTPTRTDLPITNKSTNFQLPFVEHCMNALAPGGRAAVIVPDNILFEGGRGRELRRELMRNFELHTILRLPTRIFYAQGVRTNVLFFSRPLTQPNIDATKDVWFYDLRSQSDSALNSAAFENGLREFVTAYGTDPNGGSARIDGTDNGKFRCFSREYIAERDDDLYIAWLSDDENSENELELAAPDIVAEVVERHLISALSEIRALMSELCEDGLTTDEEP
ncbi:class I SAM-dependent DNA methyltransferase [Pseudomonas sp. DD1]|uniref:class I SAM-dependent DNA methyltransferase n=1 Tax=Pseudomonas sp. DD1 TaxID=879558 RepID=UPI0037C7727B